MSNAAAGRELEQGGNWGTVPGGWPFPASRLSTAAASIVPTRAMICHLEVDVLSLFNIHRSLQDIFS